MKLTTISFLVALLSFSGFAFATNVDEWDYMEVTGNLKPSPGCKPKEEAMEKVMKKPDSYQGYSRFDKYSKLLCEEEGYGWTKDSIVDEGEVVCDECGGGYEGKYRCHMKEVKVRCKRVVR
ncbi:hypothetical protein Q9L42_006780 [Methylomarinum sp. Ch1-1]|uniref:Uncharacterized protein n=1 Tax=Methylomarinum roseum TaxID=3067653 RepID=A0AAU7NXU5_9GAMM